MAEARKSMKDAQEQGTTRGEAAPAPSGPPSLSARNPLQLQNRNPLATRFASFAGAGTPQLPSRQALLGLRVACQARKARSKEQSSHFHFDLNPWAWPEFLMHLSLEDWS